MQFEPKFPATIAGHDWRKPLNHHELEAIAKRLDHLYRNFGLSEDHRTLMLVQYGHLADADKLIDALRNVMGTISLRNDPGVRPAKPIKIGIGSNLETIETSIGFALRLSDWVQRLEDHYGVTAWHSFGQVQDREGYADPRAFGLPVLAEEDSIPQPGEDF